MIKETFDGLPLIAGVKTGSENSLLGLFSAIWSMDSCSNPSRSQSLSNSLSKKGTYWALGRRPPKNP